jgi:hypothetical protein
VYAALIDRALELDKRYCDEGWAVEEGVMRAVDPRSAAVFLWAAWDGVIAAHVLPGNMDLAEREFEEVLALGREVLARGLIASDRALP